MGEINKKNKIDKTNQSFEEMMLRLRDIEELMNSGELTLKENEELFKEAFSLIKRCKKELERSELLIEEINLD